MTETQIRDEIAGIEYLQALYHEAGDVEGEQRVFRRAAPYRYELQRIEYERKRKAGD
jgi:hypothetical protein